MSTPDSLRWLKQSMFLKYGAAVLSVTAAQFIAQWLQIHYDFEPLVPFLCAIMFSAWFGGINPGLLAVALSLLAFHYYFLIPIYPSGMEKEIPRLLFGALTSLFIVLLSATQRSATEALRESELRFRQIAENIREVFWMTTPSLDELLYVSPAYENVWGRSLESLRQRPRSFMDAIHTEDRERVVGILEGHRQQGFEVEYRIARPDGSVRWIRDRKFPVKDESEKVYRIAGVAEDITERKHAEEAALQAARKIQAMSVKNEEHLRLVIDTIPTMAWTVRPDGVVDFLNKRWMDYSGLSLEQYVKDPTGPIHPEDIPRVLEKWRANMAAGEPSEDEMRLRRADREFRWFLVRTVPLRNEQGDIVKWYGTSTEIQDRKEAEEALRQSEERFAAFMDNLPGYAWMKDLQGRYVYVNQMVRGLPGYQSLGKTDAQIWPADLAAEYRANDQQVIAAKKTLHTVEHYLHEGKQRYMVGSKFPIFDKTGAVALVGGAGMDITERVEAEEALRESEEKFRQLAENIQEVFWMTTPAMEELLYVSPAYETVWGRSLESLRQRPQSFMDAIHAEDRERVVGILEGRHQQGFEVEYRIVRPDESIRWIRDRGFPVKDPSGKVYRIAGVAEDTTERNRVDEALRQSEFDLAEAQRVGRMGSWTLDIPTNTFRGSEEFYRIVDIDNTATGISYDTLLSRVHPDDRARNSQAIAEAKASGKSFEFEHRIETRSGQLKHLHCVGYAKTDSAGAISSLFGSMQDITERKQAEIALRDSGVQLQALSRRLVELQEFERKELARELHDRIGQSLTALNINLNIMRTALPLQASDELRARLADSETLIESTTAAIGNVVSELRPPMLDDHGLASALDWYAKQFSARTGISVAVRGLESAERPASDTEIVLFRIVQEALNNVLKHARASRVEITLGRSGSDYVMSVQDDGVGYDAAGERAAPHTGLGMVTMRERAQAVGGRFEVRAASGDGTRVTVRVPA